MKVGIFNRGSVCRQFRNDDDLHVYSLAGGEGCSR